MERAMQMQGSVQALVTGWTVLTSVPRDQALENEYSPLKSGLEEALDALIRGWEAVLRRN